MRRFRGFIDIEISVTNHIWKCAREHCLLLLLNLESAREHCLLLLLNLESARELRTMFEKASKTEEN